MMLFMMGLGGEYRFGFGGQERVDEVKGQGNHYTATFWEYDPRLGRRWNLDPVIAPWESPYAVFRNNPIFWNDPDGDCSDCANEADEKNKAHKEGQLIDGDEWVDKDGGRFVFDAEIDGFIPDLYDNKGSSSSDVANSNQSSSGNFGIKYSDISIAVGGVSSSTAASMVLASDIFYSTSNGTFLGNGLGGRKLYSIDRQPNQWSGSREVAKFNSKVLSLSANTISLAGMGANTVEFFGPIVTTGVKPNNNQFQRYTMDMTVGYIGIRGGVAGAGIATGWELGRLISYTNFWQTHIHNNPYPLLRTAGERP